MGLMMKNEKHINAKAQFLLALVLLSVIATRFLELPYNLNGVGSVFLFWGILGFSRNLKLVALPFLFLAISDMHFGFYAAMPFVYLGFAAHVLVGMSLKKQKTSFLWKGFKTLSQAPKVMLATLIGSILFFVVSNFGVWITGSVYPKSIFGLLMCFEAAIPFFRNTLSGNLAFGMVLLMVTAMPWNHWFQSLSSSKEENLSEFIQS